MLSVYLFSFIRCLCERARACSTCFASFCKYLFFYSRVFSLFFGWHSGVLVRCHLPFVLFTIVIFQYHAFIGGHCIFTASSSPPSLPHPHNHFQFRYYFLECMLFNHNIKEYFYGGFQCVCLFVSCFCVAVLLLFIVCVAGNF